MLKNKFIKIYTEVYTKKVLKRFVALFAMIFCLVVATSAAKAQGGSNYSIFGIGDLIYGSSAAYQAAGGVQLAVPSTSSINILNPAMWSFVNTTRLQTGYRFNQNVVSTTSSELWQNNGGTSGFSSIFNIDAERKISIVLMFQPISTVNYYMASDIEVENENTTISGVNTYKGSGGLSALTAGVGGKITDWLYLGGSFSGVFGNMVHNSIAEFSSNYTTNYEMKQVDAIQSYCLKLGTYLTPTEKLGVGAFYEYMHNANLDSKSEYTYEVSLGDATNGPLIDKKTVETHSKEKMPQYYGLGISYAFNKVLIATDYVVGSYSNMSINRGTNTNFRDMQRFSLGAISIASSNPFAPLSEKISYKLGGYYERLYYTVNQKDIAELALTTGVQYPISRNAQIDLSFVFGSRGTVDAGLVKEKFMKMIIDISIGDTWFKKIKRQY